MGGGRSLTPVEAEAVKAALKKLARSYETQQGLAEALKVTQQTVSAIIGDRANPGYAIARAIARLLNQPVDVVLGSRKPEGGGAATTWRSMPGAEVAFGEARRMFPNVGADAWAWVEGLAGSPPPSITPVFFWSLATAYSNAPRDVVPESAAVARGRSGVQKKGAK